MSSITSARIEDHFVDLTDPRRRKVTYPLINIVTIALCAVICGADDFVSIADWAARSESGWPSFSICRAAFPRMIGSTPFWARSNRPSSRSVC